MSRKFTKLFEPGYIGKMEVRNRIVMTPMLMNFCKDGFFAEAAKDYYGERARNGVGLMIIEGSAIDWPAGKNMFNMPSVDDDKFIPSLSELTQLLKGYGPRLAIQINHSGHVAFASPGYQIVSSSTIPRPGFPIPKQLTISEIKDIEKRFADAAYRVKQAGFDGVEVMAGHLYLINSFLSNTWNNRTDEYGGSLENRARFLIEIIKAIRERVGSDYPFWIRMNAKEWAVKDGITIEEAQKVAVMAQQAGVDALNVSSHPGSVPAQRGQFGTSEPTDLPLRQPGFLIDLAVQIKKVVTIPVMVTGYITPELGEETLRQNRVDFICMGRQFIADPEFPNKLTQGREEDIRPCVRCNTCKAALTPKLIEANQPMRQCTVNPRFHKEPQTVIEPAKKAKKVLVIGGGPAGMEAARVAALRGHEVTLCERGKQLGGLLSFAGIVYPELGNLKKYYENQIKKSGIKVELGSEFNSALIDEIKPDALVLAIGAVSSIPKIPGIDRKDVISVANIRDMLSSSPKGNNLLWRFGSVALRIFGPSTVRRLMGVASPFGGKIVIMGTGLPAYEMADFLAERGKKVTILTEEETFDSGGPPMPCVSDYLIEKVADEGVAMLAGIKYEKITDDGLLISNKSHWLRTIKADTYMVLGEQRPGKEALGQIEGKVPEVYYVGESNKTKPGGVLEAIHSGFRAGLAI